MSEWASSIILKIVEWFVVFGLGVLFRKRVGRSIIKAKKRFFNDPVSINIISVRSYNPVEIHDFNQDVYENIFVLPGIDRGPGRFCGDRLSDR